MTLRSRLALGLLTIALILVVPLGIAVRSLEQLHRDAQALRDGEFTASLVLGRLREGLSELRQRETALLLAPGAPSRAEMDSTVRRVAVLTDSLEDLDLADQTRDIRDAVRDIATYAPLEYQALVGGRSAIADSISSQQFSPALLKADRGVRVAEMSLRTRTQARVNQAAIAIFEAERISLIMLVLALVVAGGIAIWLALSISRPVTELEQGMAAVADGEFDHRLAISKSRSDEFGRLAGSFETMTAQLAELDRLKAEFVSVASHELKTPINVIMGYVELLKAGIYGPLTMQQLEIHDTIDAQARALARLVKQLLDVSRFEAGGMKLEPRTLSLPHFLDDLERAFHVLAQQRDIRFLVSRREGLPEEVVWDPDRVNEVLGNLLSNAFKFTERGGDVELTVEPTDGAVQMEVHDTGAGIPEEQLPHIFEKFYQADNQGSAAHVGTGLGLAIAKQIVDAHRGTIECDSTPGVGTTFTIVLPNQVAGRRGAPSRAQVPETV